MTHTATDHLSGTDFKALGSDRGHVVPKRTPEGNDPLMPLYVAPSSLESIVINNICAAHFQLRLSNLDRSDPPELKQTAAGQCNFPRSTGFNKNVFSITADPEMPQIDVKCNVRGFDPADPKTPIHWELRLLHILGRYYRRDAAALTKKYAEGSDHPKDSHAYYHPHIDRFDHRWSGRATRSSFSLFAKSCSVEPTVSYSEALDRELVLGGHGLLIVSATPAPGIQLVDYAHLRITGTNPAKQDWERYLRHLLPTSRYDEQLFYMVAAMIFHESVSGLQFSPDYYSRRTMNYEGKGYGCNDSPRHSVTFSFPADPPHFPFATFDYGIGLTQQTYDGSSATAITSQTAWSWKVNVKAGIRELFSKMNRVKSKSSVDTWEDLAMWAWSAYNGRQSRNNAYSNALRANQYGQHISTDSLPADLSLIAP